MRDGFGRRWWALGKGKEREVAASIQEIVEQLQKQQDARRRQLVISARLYGNNSLLGLGASAVAYAQLPAAKERMTDNVIQSVVDTSVAHIGQNKPRPYFLTSGGSWEEQRRAKQLTKLCDAIFYENKSYRLGAACQRDASVFGDGMMHVFIRDGRVRHERVLSGELWVDEVEGAYGCPRQMHWERPVDRDVLIEHFPDKKAEILRADPAPAKSYGYAHSNSDMVLVRESWHLRSGPDAKDGKHCISIADCLLDGLSDWNHDFFPFARFRWCERPLGYWSQGLCEQLQSKQIELNKLLWVMQRSFHLAGTIKIFLEMGSKVAKEKLSNDIGTIIEYRGSPPQWFVPQIIPPEYYEQIRYLVSSMYDRAGINQMQATGEKPRELESGEAQRVYNDTANARQKTPQEYNQDAYLDLANMSIALAREVAEEEGCYEASVPVKGRSLETIKLYPEDLNPDGYTTQCFPTSSLPKDPAGRWASVQEWAQAGFITQRQARKLMDFPDLEANEALGNASEDIITKTLDAICDEGEYAPPEPTDDLALAMELVVDYIDRGRALGLEEERLDMLRTYKSQVEMLMQLAMPPAPAPMAAPGGGPGMPAVPAAPPVSPLLPMDA